MPDPTQQIENSILHDIKQLLGQEWDDSTYDLDVRIHINSVFFNLMQIGVGPAGGFSISGPEALWTDFLGASTNLEAVKSYIFIRVRLLFDAPTNGFLVTNLEEQARKLEWTLMVEEDNPVAIGPAPIPVEPGDLTAAMDAWAADHPSVQGYSHTQSTPATVWNIPHTFGRLPGVAVYIGGELRLAEVTATNTLVSIKHTNPESGIAILY